MKRRNFLKTGLAAIAGTSTTGPARAMARDGREPADATVAVAGAVTHHEVERQAIGWGWKDVPHGPVLASDVLGQLVDGDPSRPHFGSYGPNGGPNHQGFFLYAAMGRTDTTLGLAAHAGIGTLAVPDCWNHRVLLFDLHADGSLATRRATGLIGQARYDVMEIGSGADRLHYPTACAFDPAGQFLFVADQHNHRVLQFAMSSPSSAVRVYGQPDFESWGYDATRGDATRVLRDSLRSLYGGDGPFQLPRRPSDRGFFLPCGLVSDGKRLFVSDCDNHRVLVFDTAGTGNGPAAFAVLGQRDFHQYRPNRGGVAGPDKPLNPSADVEGLEKFYGTPGPDTMMFPTGLALDRSARYLLVADCLNYRLLVFDVGGQIRNGMPAIAVIPAPLTKQKSPSTRPTDRDFVGIVDVIVDDQDRVFVSEREGLRVLIYRLQDIITGNAQPQAAVGRFEMMTDLDQVKGLGKAEGPTALAVAGRFVYVAEPRGSRVLCYDVSDPGRRAVNVLGQSYGDNLERPHYNKYGHNGGPDPYGLSLIDGSPALSVTNDGQWLLVADSVGGRLLFFPLRADGMPLDRYARYTLGVTALTSQGSNFGAAKFQRPSHSVMTADGGLFVSDFGGSRVLYFELPDLAAASGEAALQPLREFVPPPNYISRQNRHPGYRGTKQELLFRSINSGVAATHVLGQVDFETGMRGVASDRQLGKEIGGLTLDRERGLLFVTEKHNNRIAIFDISKGVSTFMPAVAVLGQPDFDSNKPYWGRDVITNDADRKFGASEPPRRGRHPADPSRWHPAGLKEPTGACYDHHTKMFFCVNDGVEILGFDLSNSLTNGMAPAIRIGGPRSTVKTDLPRVGAWLGIDDERRRLWSEWFALDLSGDIRKSVPVAGALGLGFHPQAADLQDGHSGTVNNLLGYSVGFCHRFGGTINALAVNPRTGTVYMADNPRFRVMCFQPEFRFETAPLRLAVGQPAIGLTGTGGLAPMKFTVRISDLPHGLTVDPETGIVSGTPQAQAGEYRVPIVVQTAVGTVKGSRVIVLQNS